MNAQAATIVAIGNHSIERAHCDPDGRWQVTKHLTTQNPATLAVDPHRPAILYAGTNGHGAYRSADGGVHWEPIGPAGKTVKSLAAAPHNDEILYAGVKPAGVWKSTDGGRSWFELDGFRRIPNRWWWFSPAETPFQAYVMSLTVSPTEPDVVLAGIELGAVVRSPDGGRTWSTHRPGALRDCHDLKFHCGDGSWAYQAGGTGGGAAVSRDGGQSWQQPRAGLAEHYGVACAADPAHPEVWYVAVGPSPRNAFGNAPQAYLYRTSGGSDWQAIGWEPLPMGEMPTALATDPQAPGHLYVGTRHGSVYHSADFGDHWRKLPFEFDGVWMSLVVI
jgi:photosystem II stability/assembly factor-like uncharacterized protein